MASVYALSLDAIAERAGMSTEEFMDWACPREFHRSRIRVHEIQDARQDITNKGQLLPQFHQQPRYTSNSKRAVKPIPDIVSQQVTYKLGLATRQEKRRIAERDGKPVSGSPKRNTRKTRT